MVKKLRSIRKAAHRRVQPSRDGGVDRAPSTPPQVHQPLRGVRVAIAYDGLFPWSIGGCERWYRALAEGLVAAGASVTYVTRVQWDEPPQLDGIEVVAVRGPREIYHANGKRRADQPIRYAGGLWLWMIRHRQAFDVLHLANFPYFSVPASRAALIGAPKPIFVDWHEVWPAPYWTEYGGPLLGRIGYWIQELGIRLTPHALVFWKHTAARLVDHGLATAPVILPGLLPDPQPLTASLGRTEAQPFVFFSGRHIKDKGVRLLPEALRIARQQQPDLRLVIAGEGVETPLVRSLVAELKLEHAVDFVGKLSDADLFRYIGDAVCVAVPSVREGYGIATLEAAAHGTPAVVTDGPENLAVGHIVAGRNGFVVAPTSAAVAEGIIRVIEAGPGLRETTVQEFERMTAEHGMRRSVEKVVSLYAEALGSGRHGESDTAPARPQERVPA